MKFKLSFWVLLCAMFIIMSCDNDTEKVAGIEEYFVVSGGTLVNDKLPSTSTTSDRPELLAIHGNRNVVNGGVSNVQIESDDEFSKIIIGLKDQEVGYYELTDLLKSATTNTTITLLISEEFIGSMTVVFAIISADGLVSSYEEIETHLVESVGGALQINCSWDLLNDIDLHVVKPDGDEIYYGNSGMDYDYIGIYNHFLGLNLSDNMSFEEIENIELTDEQWDVLDNLTQSDLADYTILLPGGSLDIDSNPGCRTDGINSENVVFDIDDVQAGEYIVRVDFFEDCIGAGTTNFVVSAKFHGDLISTDGDNPVTSSFIYYEEEFGELGDGVEIMRFTISENQLKSGVYSKSTLSGNQCFQDTNFPLRSMLKRNR